jgi:hypothetical protein
VPERLLRSIGVFKNYLLPGLFNSSKAFFQYTITNTAAYSLHTSRTPQHCVFQSSPNFLRAKRGGISTIMATSTAGDGMSDDQRMYEDHMSLLKMGPDQPEGHDLVTMPIFSKPAHNYVTEKLSGDDEKGVSQYGLIAGSTELLSNHKAAPGEAPAPSPDADPRLFFNIGAPSSAFICGSQGSGKSHTLSCLIENCLIPSKANVLPSPLTGLIFHYDSFISDRNGSPCEAAYLSSNPGIKVRVLCAPTNYQIIKVSLCSIIFG